jgi:hypothetical protein
MGYHLGYHLQTGYRFAPNEKAPLGEAEAPRFPRRCYRRDSFAFGSVISGGHLLGDPARVA